MKISVGDSQYASTHTVSVNGVSFWTNQATAVNQFVNKTLSVTVTNGKLTLTNGSSAEMATRLNYIEIQKTA